MSEPKAQRKSIEDLGCCNPWVCAQCGVCAGVCPVDAIRASVDRWGYRYPVVRKADCTHCGLCGRVCPGPRLTHHAPDLPAPSPPSGIYGPLRRCLLAHATDNATRWAASSGGFVTALLLSLHQQGVIAGAVVTDLNTAGCWPRTFLARNPEEILGASGSKYAISSYAAALHAVLCSDDGPFAFVGLPCQIHGLRRALRCNPRLRAKVALGVSLFCAGTKDARYQWRLLRKLRVRPSAVKRFAYRGSGWPGVISAQDEAGTQAACGCAEADVGPVFSQALLTPRRCLLCDDPLGAHADVAVGDPWHLAQAASDSAGQSLVIVRTARGAELLNLGAENGDIAEAGDLSPEDVFASQTGLLWRRYYAPSRVKLVSAWAPGWRETAGAVPRPSVVNLLKAVRALAVSRGRSLLLRETWTRADSGERAARGTDQRARA